MPGDDLSMTIAFLFFLTAFVLIGIYPSWQRTAQRLRSYLNPRDESATDMQPFDGLNEVEFLLLQRLARSRRKTSSRNRLAAELHLKPAAVEQGLESLRTKGLVRFFRPYLSGKRYTLSARGRTYATEQGYIPNIGSRGK